MVTYRTDDLHRQHPLHALLPVWTRIAHVERLELGRLSGARAEGNPFFAEELASAGERDVRVEDLNRLVLRRMDELGGPGRQIVRAAAVGGRTVSHDLLASVSALAEEEFDSAVADAVEHHILEVTPTGVYTFRHALLAEAVATDLLPGTRRRLHTAYLEVLRSVPGLGGRSYGAYAGLALEPQIWPDSPNRPYFPQAVLWPGGLYRQVTEYRFR